MSPTLDSTLDPQQLIAELQRQLAERTAERDHLRSERDEALEQQTATAEVLGVINSSPGELEPVFDTMLEKAIRLCEAAHGYFLTYDGEAFHPTTIRSKPGFEEFWRRGGPERQGGPVRPSHPSNPLAQLARGALLVHVADAREEEAYREVPEYRSVIDLGGIRTSLTIPLRKEGTLLGAVRVYRQEVRPFTDKQIALLQNFAAQAVIAMENARLITETREALEQQTATAEVLQVINSSPGDLAPVFDAILEKAHRVCGAPMGSLVLYDGERLRAVATRGYPSEYDAIAREGGPTQMYGPFAGLLRGERYVGVADAAALPPNPLRSALVEIAGVRTALFVPLRKDGALLGYISFQRPEVLPFTEGQIGLLENFAAQAVIAMENARLLDELRARTRDLQESLEYQIATSDVLKVISRSTLDLQPVLDTLVATAARLCEADDAVINILEEDAFRVAAIFSVPEFDKPEFDTLIWGRLLPVGRGTVTGRTLLEGQVVHVTDIASDPEYTLTQAVTTGKIGTMLGVPLLREEVVIGTVTVSRKRVQPFAERQIELVRTFAAQAVIAMENARLITETREALEQQTATAEVLQVINSSPGDLAPVFDAMLEKAMRLCHATGGALRSYENGVFRAVAMRGMSPEFWEATREVCPHPTTGLGRIENGEHAVQIADIANVSIADPGRRREMIELGGIRTSLWVALRKDEHLLGTFVLYRREVCPFSETEVGLVRTFADQAVIAMENARLLGELRQRTDEVGELNRDLEARVAEQVDELGRVGRLKRFLAPQLAELIVSQGDEKILESHRREIVVVFCDLRGYTAFTETAEPEEVLDFLRQYHGALGPLVSQFEGTLDQFSGDGIMVFFNDPVPCPDPAERAVKMAVAMRDSSSELIAAWSRHGCELGFGVGIAQGFATLGQIGFSERSGYTAIGTVCNLAARLCAEAKDGQILVSSRIAEAVEAVARLEDLGNLDLKGLRRPVAAFNVAQSTSPAEARPNLTVVARDTGA